MFYNILKRFFDIAIASIILVVLSPLLILVALLIKYYSPGPILYKGKRVGRHGKPFYMFKFRSMVIDAEKKGGPSTSGDDPRLTKIGIILRKFKLDELPQFFNVMRGEMSIVGPRPDVEEVIACYTDKEKPILSVMPGITDYASLWNFAEAALLYGSIDPHTTYMEKIWPTKVQLQLKYIDEQSLLTDIKIILLTSKKTLYSLMQKN